MRGTCPPSGSCFSVLPLVILRRNPAYGYGSIWLSNRGGPHPSHSGTHPPPPLAQKKSEGGGGVPSPTSNMGNTDFFATGIVPFCMELSPECISILTFSWMSKGGIPTPRTEGGVATHPPHPGDPPPPLPKKRRRGGGGTHPFVGAQAYGHKPNIRI